MPLRTVNAAPTVVATGTRTDTPRRRPRDGPASADEDTMSKPKRTETQSPAPQSRRPPRSDPRAGRAGEQPQGHRRRDPEAPADRVHWRLRLGQELAGIRYHRRGVAAADQRDLQRLPAGLHADAGAA